MANGKDWTLILLLLVGFWLPVLGCSQSDETAGARNSAADAKADIAPVPPATAAGTSPPVPPSSGARLTIEATGRVISADPANKMLVVQSETGAIAFEVQDRLVDDLQGLRPGDKVTVRYTQEAGKNSAETIQRG